MVNLKAMQAHISAVNSLLTQYDDEVLEQAEIQLKYDTYIVKEQELVKKMQHLENLVIPDHFDYQKLPSLSAEAKQKFLKIKPRTLGQASRISGVNPSDVQVLMVYMGR
jgi:tRNA uridine 5-carboxymethylaminomethyl modification enzyme